MFLCIKKSDLHNLAGDNIISTTCNTLTVIFKTLEQESESAVRWFKQNEIIVNSDKFRAIILNKNEIEAKYELTIDKNNFKSSKSVKLLCIAMDDRVYDLINTNQICVSNLEYN